MREVQPSFSMDSNLNDEGLEYEAIGQEDFDFDDINDGFYDAFEEDGGLFLESDIPEEDFHSTPFGRPGL